MSFYQVNHDQAQRLYAKAAEYAGLTGKESVLDLYCGTGTITLYLASRSKRVLGVEIVGQAIEDARENAKRNGIENAEFECADAAETAKRLVESGEAPDVIVVDPPRKGLAAEVPAQIASMNPKRIVYVSCAPETLARDVKTFSELGYSVMRCSAVDMFPGTCHVETVVLMSKVKG
jgi:23S rRNA (uracil1939-C5)-methyltransferase